MPPTGEAMDQQQVAGPSVASLWPLFVAAFTATYTFSVANVAAPALAVGLSASRGEVALFLGSFAAAFASCLILAGRLGDRYGRKRLFVTGLAAAVVTAVLAAVAPSVPLLVGARVLQGVAAAMVMPQILGTIQASLTGAERNRALATFAAVSGVGTASGQIIGGGLISLNPGGLSWRAALASLALINGAALAGSARLPSTKARACGTIDLRGALLVGASLMALVAALSLGPSLHWSPLTFAMLALGVLGLAAFWFTQVSAERAGRAPLMPPSVVRLPPVRAGLVMAMLFFGGFGAFMYDFSVLTQTGFGLSPAASGLATVPFAAAFVITSVKIGAVTARWGGRTMERAGALQAVALLTIAGLSVVAVVSDAGLAWVWWAQLPFLLLGAAQAAQFGPLVATVMRHVPDQVAGLTGGMISTAQQTALGLSAATIGAVFLATAQSAGWQVGFAVSLVVQACAAGLFVLLARSLRRGDASLVSPGEGVARAEHG